MWQVLMVSFVLGILPTVIKSAWVEIPQVSNKKQFVFGSPNFPLTKYSTTTLANYKTMMTTTATPKTTMLTTTTPAPVSQLKKPIMSDRMDEVVNLPLKKKINEKVRNSLPNLKNKTVDEEKPESSNSYSGFLPLLNSIQQTLIMNAKKTLKSKILLLTNLRDNLLLNIDERMTKLWNNNKEDDAVEGRGHHEEHEMDFPSNEGALLTIAFLTFAVFLIKLVLKLIHALKNKTTTTMMNMTDMANAGGTGAMPMPTGIATYFGRKRRDVNDYDSLRILQLIDEYKFS